MAGSFHVRPIQALDHSAVSEMARLVELELDLDVELGKPWTVLFVSEVRGGPLASYALGWQLADEFELVQVAAAPEFRRRGAGRAVLQALLDEARFRGCRAAFLEVRASNVAARGLYRELGFVETRIRSGYYSDGEDAVEMRHSLV